MTDENQSEGTDKGEQLEQIQHQAETISERAKTADERLNQFFAPPAEEKPQEPIPSSEKPETKPEVKAEEPKEEPKAEEPKELPENASDRTREEFEKLKQHNKQLAEKVKTFEKQYGSSVFDTPNPVQPPQVDIRQFNNLSPQQATQIQQQFVSPDGPDDIDALNKALTLANQRSQQAQFEALQTQERIQKFEESMQVRELHSKHPELDPSNEKFDPTFFELVRDRLVANKVQRLNVSPTAVADSIRGFYKPSEPVNLDKVKDEAVTEYKKSQEKRTVQTPVESGKGSPRGQDASQLKSLRDRTRRGDPFALDERLRAVGVLDQHKT